MANTAIMDTLCLELRIAGMNGRDERRIEGLARKWIDSCGEEWTLKRFKTLQDYFINLKNDPSYPLPDGFAKNRKGELAGQLRLFAHMNFQTQMRVLGAVQSAFIFTDITDSQWEKWSSGVLREKQDLYTEPELQTLTDELADTVSRKVNFKRLCKQTEDQLAKMEIPLLDSMTGESFPYFEFSTRVKNEDKESYQGLASLTRSYIQQWESLPTATMHYISNLVSEDMLPGHTVLPDYHNFDIFDRSDRCINFGDDTRSDVIGRIGYIQQAKGKLRAVANPNRIAQAYSIPFGEALQYECDKDPHSFVRNQDEGHLYIQDLIRKKEFVIYSMDLSAATDTLNFDVLRNAYSQAASAQGADTFDLHMDYFDDLSNGLWYSQELEKREDIPYITFQQGQPLGLRPSFPFLSMSNSVIAEYAFEKARSLGYSGPTHYAVVGDDMAIAVVKEYAGTPCDPASIYSDTIGQLGSEANLEKTLTSTHMAEFCGKVITPCKIVQKTPKWTPKKGILADLSALEYFPAIYNELRKDIQQSVESIRKVPSSLGGLYGKFKPRTDISKDDGERAYAIARDSLDSNKYAGKSIVRPTIQMNTALIRAFNRMGIEQSNHWFPKFEDLESQLPTAEVFDYKQQRFISKAAGQLSGITKIAKRIDQIIPSDKLIEEFTSSVVMSTQDNIRFVSAYNKNDNLVHMMAFRMKSDEPIWEQVDVLEFYSEDEVNKRIQKEFARHDNLLEIESQPQHTNARILSNKEDIQHVNTNRTNPRSEGSKLEHTGGNSSRGEGSSNGRGNSKPRLKPKTTGAAAGTSRGPSKSVSSKDSQTAVSVRDSASVPVQQVEQERPRVKRPENSEDSRICEVDTNRSSGVNPPVQSGELSNSDLLRKFEQVELTSLDSAFNKNRYQLAGNDEPDIV